MWLEVCGVDRYPIWGGGGGHTISYHILDPQKIKYQIPNKNITRSQKNHIWLGGGTRSDNRPLKISDIRPPPPPPNIRYHMFAKIRYLAQISDPKKIIIRGCGGGGVGVGTRSDIRPPKKSKYQILDPPPPNIRYYMFAKNQISG